jgi:RNA polymerase sigma factor (sigma-70 family)
MKEDNSIQLKEDNEILRRIKDDDARVITHVYKKYHDEFLRFVRKGFPQFSIESTEDAFNESFNALYRNVKVGRLKSLSSSLKTYLFQIGKYKVIDEINRCRKTDGSEIITFIPDQEILSLDLFEEKDLEIKKTRLLSETVERLKETCKTLLKLFWYDKKSDKEILELTDYKDTDTVKNQRSRCMKALRKTYLTELVNKKLITNSEMKRLMGE